MKHVKYSKEKLSRYRHADARGGRGIARIHSLISADGVSGQRHTPAVLYPREKDPQYLLDRRLRGPQSWS
jgi:hypothetical protein